jgi:hypothetical protein
MDIDDYINSLIKDNENLRNEIRIQRKEIAGLREERRKIINDDNSPGYDPEWNISIDDSDSKKLGLI